MRILVAPDKFKGTAAAQTVAESIRTALGDDHELLIQPLADGEKEQLRHLEDQIAPTLSQVLLIAQ